MREWGEHLKALEQLALNGKKVKALENRPLLSLGLEIYLSAYYELSYDRPVGFSVGNIPWSSIIKWCEIHGIRDIDEIGVFMRHIRALERVDAEIADKKRVSDGR